MEYPEFYFHARREMSCAHLFMDYEEAFYPDTSDHWAMGVFDWNRDPVEFYLFQKRERFESYSFSSYVAPARTLIRLIRTQMKRRVNCIADPNTLEGTCLEACIYISYIADVLKNMPPKMCHLEYISREQKIFYFDSRRLRRFGLEKDVERVNRATEALELYSKDCRTTGATPEPGRHSSVVESSNSVGSVDYSALIVILTGIILGAVLIAIFS